MSSTLGPPPPRSDDDWELGDTLLVVAALLILTWITTATGLAGLVAGWL